MHPPPNPGGLGLSSEHPRPSSVLELRGPEELVARDHGQPAPSDWPMPESPSPASLLRFPDDSAGCLLGDQRGLRCNHASVQPARRLLPPLLPYRCCSGEHPSRGCPQISSHSVLPGEPDLGGTPGAAVTRFSQGQTVGAFTYIGGLRSPGGWLLAAGL